MLLLLVAKGSSEKAVLNRKSFFRSNHHSLMSCTGGFTFNACAVCSGCQFTSRDDLTTAFEYYVQNKMTAINTYGEMNCWDVSDITNVNEFFRDKFTFDEPIKCWDVRSVTDMSFMLRNATVFNQDIGERNSYGHYRTIRAMLCGIFAVLTSRWQMKMLLVCWQRWHIVRCWRCSQAYLVVCPSVQVCSRWYWLVALVAVFG